MECRFRRSCLIAGGIDPEENTINISTRANYHIHDAEKSKESSVEISMDFNLTTRGERVCLLRCTFGHM